MVITVKHGSINNGQLVKTHSQSPHMQGLEKRQKFDLDQVGILSSLF